jgi:hypothetical protein
MAGKTDNWSKTHLTIFRQEKTIKTYSQLSYDDHDNKFTDRSDAKPRIQFQRSVQFLATRHALNGNTNHLLCQYRAKHSSYNQITIRAVESIIADLNSRRGKKVHYQTLSINVESAALTIRC